jgi:hypothetical protein
MNPFNITTADRRKAVRIHLATLVSDRPQLDYAVRKIASRARISAAQASVIAELIGLSAEARP